MNTKTNINSNFDLNQTNSHYLDQNFNLVSDQNTSTARYKITPESNNKIVFSAVSYDENGVENCEQICITDRRMYRSDMLSCYPIFKLSFIQGSMACLFAFIASTLALIENNIPLTA